MPIAPFKPLFLRGPSLGTRLLVCVLAAVSLMVVDHRYQHLQTLRAMLSIVVYPLQVAVHAPFAASRWISENAASKQTMASENARLRREHLLIRARLGKFEELEAENRRLRQLLDSSTKVGERVLIAEVMAVDMDPFSRRILLNKGERDGVYVGQPLIDGAGIMGQVVHVGPYASTGLLITDPSHALPVQVNRSGLRAIALGSGAAGTLQLLHLPYNADVEPGDLLLTSGLGGRFPAGHPVGKVLSVDTDGSQAFARVIVQPAAQLERNREVLLVWPPGQESIGMAGMDDRSRGVLTARP